MMAGARIWFDTLFYGVRHVFSRGQELSERNAVNFAAPLKAADDSGNGYSTVNVNEVSSSGSGVVVPTTGSNKVLYVTAGGAGAWATITNALVDAAAAIDGTKITPAFGAQNINTTGTLTVGLTYLTGGGAVKVETLSGTRVITTADPHFLKFDANGADRDVDLPAEETSEGLWYRVYNYAGGFGLRMRNDAGATIVTISPGQCRTLVCDGTSWVDMGG